jgi:hypothetical protein
MSSPPIFVYHLHRCHFARGLYTFADQGAGIVLSHKRLHILQRLSSNIKNRQRTLKKNGKKKKKVKD